MADLLLIRHAEPEASGVFLGSLDVPLSARGREQAAALHLALQREPPFERVYASPLRRAQETALALGHPVHTLAALAEIHYGPWEGLSWAQIETKYPEEAERKMQDWLGYTVPGAEPWADFQARVQAVLEEILSRQKHAVVVAHLGVNSIVHQQFSRESPIQFRQAYCQALRYAL